MLALKGNVLLVIGMGETVAWRLTEGRMEDGPGTRRADRGDSIPLPVDTLLTQDQKEVMVDRNEHVAEAYHNHRGFGMSSTSRSENDWQISLTTLREGWVKDFEGRHRLWVPPPPMETLL